MKAFEVRLGEQLQALLGVGAVETDDQRHVHVDARVGLDDAPGDLVAAGDPAEDVEQHRVDLLVGGDDLECVDDRVGLRAAAGVEEVRGLAAGVGDDVERRHAEAGAVTEDADVAVELDVGEALLLGHPLLGILGGILLRGQFLVAVEGGAVDRDLGVEGDDPACGGDDQRVDLDQRRVEVVEGSVELDQVLGDSVDDVLVDSGVDGQRGRVVVGQADQRVDVEADEGVGIALGDRLDVHPAHPGEDHQRHLGRAVEDYRGVVLGVDLRCLLDPDLMNREGSLAVRADDVHPEDGIGMCPGFVLILGDLDPAGLATTADQDLGLDHAGIADAVGRGHRRVDVCSGFALGDGDARLGEELLALKFE